jgi:hypothetical protein
MEAGEAASQRTSGSGCGYGRLNASGGYANVDKEKIMKDSISGRKNAFSRRDLLTFTGGLTASYLLGGCGGGSGGTNNGGSGNVAIVGRSVTVSFTPLPGIAASQLKCATGWGAVTGLANPALITVMQGNPTLAFVTHAANSKLVMVGMIDDSVSSHTIDYTNMAATLVFLRIGGVQTPVVWRKSLWQLVLADSAVLALAAVVKTRLAADPYALENQDPQILTALKTAVTSLQPATVAALRPLPATKQAPVSATRQTKVPSREHVIPVAIPVPAVKVIEKNLDPGPGVERGPYPPDGAPDLMQYENTKATEMAYLTYEYKRTDAQGAILTDSPASLVSGPDYLSYVSRRVIPPEIPSVDFTTPLKQTTDQIRAMSFIVLRPVFDSPISTSRAEFEPYYPVWKTILTPLYQRAATHLAVLNFMEALGRGGVLLTLDELRATVAQFSPLSPDIAQAITAAGLGQDAAGSANRIINACLASDTRVGQVLQVFGTLFGIRSNDVNRTLLRSSYRLFNWFNTFEGDLASDFFNSCANTGPFRLDYPPCVSIFDYYVEAVKFKISADPPAYETNGIPVTLSSLEDPNTPRSPRFSNYHWKLTGTGNATLTDDAGHTGREFDTEKSEIRFLPGTSSVGDQTVTVRIDNKELPTSIVLSGNAALVLPQTLLQIIPASPVVDPATTKTFIVQYSNGTPFASGITFKWTLAGTGSIGGGTTATTTTPTINYTAPTTPNQDTLTVELFDSTGHSLGKLSTVITVSAPSRVTPHNPSVRFNATQIFTVAPLAGAYPTGATYTWSLTGNGTLGGASPVVTNQPQITYTAPSAASNDTLVVTVKDATGKVLATAGTTITVETGSFTVPVTQKFITVMNYKNGQFDGTYYVVGGYAFSAPTRAWTHMDAFITGGTAGGLDRADYEGGAPVFDSLSTPAYAHQGTASHYYNLGNGTLFLLRTVSGNVTSDRIQAATDSDRQIMDQSPVDHITFT